MNSENQQYYNVIKRSNLFPDMLELQEYAFCVFFRKDGIPWVVLTSDEESCKIFASLMNREHKLLKIKRKEQKEEEDGRSI